MHEYDIALKSLLRNGRESMLALTPVAVERWHHVELPEVRNLRVDLLGESSDKRLVHIELQSTHDSDMALRMLEYSAAVFRQFGRFPEQIVLYVGRPRLRITGVLRGPNFSFKCRIVDIRELDSERLLASEQIEDNVILVLAGVGDQRVAVRRILGRIASADPAARSRALAAFMILAGLRQLEEVIEQEANRMPILDDIMDHKVLGREFKRGLEQGLHDGELAVLLPLIEKRFGALPASARERLDRMTAQEVESVALRLLDVRNIEELLG